MLLLSSATRILGTHVLREIQGRPQTIASRDFARFSGIGASSTVVVNASTVSLCPNMNTPVTCTNDRVARLRMRGKKKAWLGGHAFPSDACALPGHQFAHTFLLLAARFFCIVPLLS